MDGNTNPKLEHELWYITEFPITTPYQESDISHNATSLPSGIRKGSWNPGPRTLNNAFLLMFPKRIAAVATKCAVVKVNREKHLQARIVSLRVESSSQHYRKKRNEP
jgi:hypothetical protein